MTKKFKNIVIYLCTQLYYIWIFEKRNSKYSLQSLEYIMMEVYVMNKKMHRKVIFNILLLLFMLAIISGCKKGESEKEIKNTSSIKITKTKTIAKTTKSAQQTSAKTVGQDEDVDVNDEEPGEFDDDESEFEEEQTIDFRGQTIVISSWSDTSIPQLGVTEAGDITYRTFERAKEKYNCNIEWKVVLNPAYATEFLNASLAGLKFADIAFIHTDQAFPAWIKQDFLEPLDEYLDNSKGWWNTEAYKWDGKSYAIEPISRSGLGYITIYNYDLLQKEGLPDILELSRNNQWNWDSLLDITIASTRDLDGNGINDQWGISAFGIDGFILFSNGVMPVVKQGDMFISALKERNSINALQFLYDLKNIHKVVNGETWAGAVSMNEANNNFVNGKLAILNGMLNNAKTVNDMGMKTLRAAPLPMGPDVSEYQNIAIQAAFWGIPRNKSYYANDLVEFYCDAINTWDEYKPEFFNPKDGAIENWGYKILNSYENAEYLWDFTLTNPKKMSYTRGLGVAAIMTNQVVAPVIRGTKSVGTVLAETDSLISETIANALK